MLGANNNITVTRLGTGTHQTYSVSVGTGACYLERMGLNQASLVDAGNPYEIYEAITGLDGIKVNDKVLDRANREYRVLSAERVNDFIDFTKLIMRAVVK
jgi:hypothetical protein